MQVDIVINYILQLMPNVLISNIPKYLEFLFSKNMITLTMIIFLKSIICTIYKSLWAVV